MMNCIIVADKANCILLEEFVGKSSSLNLIETFSDSTSARSQLSKQQDIDLIFLDLETLKMDSFDFITSLECRPNIIMVSSGDQDALKAFDLNVVDYLLKPVTYSRFCKAIDKAVRYYSCKEISNSSDNEIFIKKGMALAKLKIKDIIYVEALENYVTLNTNDERYTIHFTMKGIQNQLPPGVFIRIHRSFIVNKSMIQAINENNIDLIVGDTFKNLPLGKSFRDSLLNNINLMAR
jgi:DNA-binding LytR/AlgR family response regulator